MIQVNSSQFNYQYFGQIHFPFSIALLVAYLKSQKNINQSCKFHKTFVFRDKVDDYIKQCKNTDVLLCSCYVWNWEITTHLAKEVKKLNPNCTIIFGGPQVPRQSEGFFEKYPFVDIIVHGEGEYIIKNIFNAYLKDKDYSNVKGIETKLFKNQPESRINDFEELPSPYLTNLVWDLVEKRKGVQWIASWETNRGCPYACTFCDWGSATNTKLRTWSEERLFKEIEWFVDNKINYIDCCDANFGILQERDMRIAEKLKEAAMEKNFPEVVRPNWAKFSSEKIIPIAKKFQEAGLLRAVTLSVQSMDEGTLDIIKRENMKFNEFSELTATFRKNGIPTYTEIIIGLPGESLESFKNGLETLVSDTKVGSIEIYDCKVLPNAPMNDPMYIKRYKIKTIRSPIFLAHSQIDHGTIQEYEYITVGAFSFTLDDLKEMNLYRWMVQTLHSLGILEYISTYYKKIHGLSVMKFFETFLEFCRIHESIFSLEYEKIVNHVDNGYAGKGWDHYDPNLGDIFWPIEEASWLRLIDGKKKLVEGILSFLAFLEEKHGYRTPINILDDLTKFQVFLLTVRTEDEIKSEDFEFNWKNFFVDGRELKHAKTKYSYRNLVIENDTFEWNYKTIWFGRFKKKYKMHPENLQEEKYEVKIKEILSK